MRTTIDLPDDLHRVLVSVARDRSQSLSRTVVDVVRKALEPDDSPTGLTRSPVMGLMVMRGNGKPITNDDVRAVKNTSSTPTPKLGWPACATPSPRARSLKVH